MVGAQLTAAVTGVGIFLANSYLRRINLHLADKGMAAHGRLWALTAVARPTRIEFEDNPLTT